MPNKDKPIDSQTGTIDKRMEGPLLADLAYNTIALPIIDYVPELEPTKTPTIFIQPPNFVRFQNTSPVETNVITFDNVYIMQQYIYTLKKLPSTEDLHNKYFNSMPTLNSYSCDIENQLIPRLLTFLESQIPYNQKNLLPGYH